MILLTGDLIENLAMTSEQMASLQPAMAKLLERFRSCFERGKTFGYLETRIRDLLSDVKRKSIEPIALWPPAWRCAPCRNSWRSFAGTRTETANS